jgi:hypothetical protein
MRYVGFWIVALVVGIGAGRLATASNSPVGASTPGSVSSCVKSCNGDEGCIHCCRCVAAGGSPTTCCF